MDCEEYLLRMDLDLGLGLGLELDIQCVISGDGGVVGVGHNTRGFPL